MEQGIVADGVYSSRDLPAKLKRLGDRATGRRWTLTTHLRARVVQAGALLALVGGILVVAPSAALAVKPNVTIDNVSTDIASGGTTNLKYTITNNNGLGGQSQVQVQVSGISCTSGECGAVVTIAPTASVQRSATLTAPQVSAGQTKVVNLQITATIDGDTFTASQQLNVHGADKPKTVHQIVGVVKDTKGNAISGANVGMKDSAGTNFGTTSNGNGGYVFTSSDSQPIATGSIVVGAAKEGYKTVTVTVQGGADKTVNVPLTLQSLAASPSASPSASASASAEPSSPAAQDTAATDQPSAAANGAANAASNNSSSGSTLYIILGVLLVAAGIGAIVLVLMRRRNSGDPDDPDDPNGPSGPNGVVPPSQGRFNGVDPTRVGAPVGPRANDATMVANMGGQPSISDAPTMLQRAVPAEDEFPDPYGAPAVTPGNYAGPGGWGTTSAAAAAGTYGAAQPGGTYGGGYSAANQYGGAAPAPAQAAAGYDDGGYGTHPYARAQNEEAYGAYGAGQYGGGAAEQQRFDEPTGMYRPEPAADYRQDQGGYDQGGYDQGGYGQGQPAGYDQGGQPGYGQAGYDQGGYRQEPEYPPAGGRGGYQQPGGYSGGGYGGAPEPADDQGGYGSRSGTPGGGIDSGNGYGPPARGDGGYGQGGGGYAGGPAGGGPGYGADQGGYDPRATYGRPDSGGYEQGGGRRQQGGGGYGAPDQGQGGYGAPADQGQGGYGAPADQGQGGGYYAGEQDSGGGRHGAQPPRQQPESTHPGQRRPLDWLDD
jgi:hypothetical protein